MAFARVIGILPFFGVLCDDHAVDPLGEVEGERDEDEEQRRDEDHETEHLAMMHPPPNPL